MNENAFSGITMIKFTPQLKTSFRSFRSFRSFTSLNNVKGTSLLRTNPHLIPQVTLSKQIKNNVLRCFSNTSITNYYRPPKNYVNSGIIGRLWSRIPDSVKILGLVGATASLVIFVALPMFVIVVPPLAIGGWLFYKINNYTKSKKLVKVWNDIADSSLVFKPQRADNPLILPSPDVVYSQIAHFEMNRIIDAFWSNEQGIADYFKVDDIDNLALGTLEAIEYNYNSTSVLFAEEYFMLVTQQRTLYDKSTGKELATVVLTLKCMEKPMYEGIIDPSANIGKSVVMIEIIPKALMAPKFVLKTPSVSTSNVNDNWDDGDDDDGFIDVKGRTKTL